MEGLGAMPARCIDEYQECCGCKNWYRRTRPQSYQPSRDLAALRESKSQQHHCGNKAEDGHPEPPDEVVTVMHGLYIEEVVHAGKHDCEVAEQNASCEHEPSYSPKQHLVPNV